MTHVYHSVPKHIGHFWCTVPKSSTWLYLFLQSLLCQSTTWRLWIALYRYNSSALCFRPLTSCPGIVGCKDGETCISLDHMHTECVGKLMCEEPLLIKADKRWWINSSLCPLDRHFWDTLHKILSVPSTYPSIAFHLSTFHSPCPFLLFPMTTCFVLHSIPRDPRLKYLEKLRFWH